MKQQKHVILITWKATGATEVWGTLKAFTDAFTQYSYHSVTNYLTRQNKPFEDELAKIERKEIIK